MAQIDLIWGAVNLAVASNNDVVGNIRVNGQRLSQVAEFLRAQYANPLYRQNSRAKLSFSVAVLHYTVTHAIQYLASQAIALSAETATTVVMKLGGTTILTLNNALVESDDGEISGLTTTHRYNCVGGYFS